MTRTSNNEIRLSTLDFWKLAGVAGTMMGLMFSAFVYFNSLQAGHLTEYKNEVSRRLTTLEQKVDRLLMGD